MDRENLTRRGVLATLGASGIAATGVGFGALTLGTAPSLAHNNEMETEESGNDLLFEWVETYNGTVLEGPDNVTASPGGMQISLSNVLPGDTGALGIKMTLESASGSDPSVTPYFAFNKQESAENGINEPEQEDGDTTASDGELDEFIDVTIWYDTGLMNIEQWGQSNNEKDPTEDLIHPDAEGTLEEVARDLPSSVDLDTADPVRLDPVNGNCLTSDSASSVRIAFGWEFPNRQNVNVTQSDSVSFDLLFRGEGGCQ